jgi:response regulator NasT
MKVPAMNATTKSNRHILIVDDDEYLRSFLSAVLQNAGYATTEVASAEEALKLALMDEPDIALLDINLPGMSGLDLAHHLQNETTVPFIFLSAKMGSDIVKQATEYGALGYLVKPIDTMQLLPAMEAGLARADEIKKLRRNGVNLTSALVTGRETSMAVGLLMGKFQSDRNRAFEVLRDHARSHRRKINEVASDVLEAEELLNQFKAMFASKLASHAEVSKK